MSTELEEWNGTLRPFESEISQRQTVSLSAAEDSPKNKQYCVYKLAPHLHLSLKLNSQVQSRAFLGRSLEVYFSRILSICCSKSSLGATVEGTSQVHWSQKWLRWGHTSSQMPPIMPQCPPPKVHRSKKEHRPLSPGLELVKGEILGHTSQGCQEVWGEWRGALSGDTCPWSWVFSCSPGDFLSADIVVFLWMGSLDMQIILWQQKCPRNMS